MNIFQTTYKPYDFRLLPAAGGGSLLVRMVMLLCVIIIGLCALAPASFALPADRYAASSRLASGQWVKVRVATPGVQFISVADLRKMGFSDPSKVKVFGLGGRQLPESLSGSHPDDLPRVASEITSKGLYFFGYDHIRWDYAPSSRQALFSHKMHSYAEESWYFLSDSATDVPELPVAPATPVGASVPVVDSFIQPLLHEQDLVHPSTTGSRYLGEDFRSPTRRTFDFSLPDAVEGEDCFVKYTFATNTTAVSNLDVTATGKSGRQDFNSQLNSVADGEVFMAYSTSQRTVSNPGNTLRLDFTFRGAGTIRMARLDYIEVQYRRRLRLADGQLHFTITESLPARVRLSGAETSTIIWDITDPGNPMRVDATLSGSELTFTAAPGYHEYVAFTPDKTGYQIGAYANVSNQDLHSLPTPDMLIIAPAYYSQAAARMAAHHRDHDGLKVEVLQPELIYNEFSSGTPDATAFRRLLKMWHDRSAAESTGIRYCLIMGSATFDNKLKMETTKMAEHPFVPIWQSPTGESGTTSYSCDDYIGMLADSETFDISRAKIHVAVGRMPFLSSSEALTLTDKYIRYATQPEVGMWRNKMMFIADDQNRGDHLNQSEDMINAMAASPEGRRFRYEKVYLDSYPLVESGLGPTYPQARNRMLNLWNSGVAYINYIGHANPSAWTHENLLTWNDITTFSNTNLPFIYAATCEFGRLDAESRSGAEVLWALPEGGVIGILTPSRTVYIDQNGKLSRQIAKAMFGADGRQRTVGEIMVEAKNNYPDPSNTNKLRYILIGDPAMKLPVPTHNVELTRLDGEDVEAMAEMPVLKAQGRAKIEGVVRDAQGAVAENFDGLVEITLYDAEKSVETLGNGESGVISYYNDRQTLLYRGIAKAEKGHWATEVLLPSEIENNFSPAQFIFYAYTPDRVEAHGEFSGVYVYGTDDNAPADSEGPEISLFTLNREDFQPGQVVHTTPVAMARISDASGINISDAGIGHSMMLTLDDRTYFTDVNSYYTPDADDVTAGSVTYPLSEIAPGKHTLKLTVWDNAKNSSTATIDFEVAVAKAPEIYTLSTDVNPARDHVNFTLSTDRPKAEVSCTIEVFDLNGRRVWTSQANTRTDLSAALTVPWNLCDAVGTRVPRGIYLYRATIVSPEGPQASKSYKLAVTAP